MPIVDRRVTVGGRERKLIFQRRGLAREGENFKGAVSEEQTRQPQLQEDGLIADYRGRELKERVKECVKSAGGG